jgi:hypothetical protein
MDDGVVVVFRCDGREFCVSRESAVISGYVREAILGEMGVDRVVIDVSRDDVGVEMLGYVVRYLEGRRGVDLMEIPFPLRSLDWDVVFSDGELGGYGSDVPECVDGMCRERYDVLVSSWRYSQRGDYGEIRRFVRDYLDMVGEENVGKWVQLSMVASYFDIRGLVSLCAAVVAMYVGRKNVDEIKFDDVKS